MDRIGRISPDFALISRISFDLALIGWISPAQSCLNRPNLI